MKEATRSTAGKKVDTVAGASTLHRVGRTWASLLVFAAGFSSGACQAKGAAACAPCNCPCSSESTAKAEDSTNTASHSAQSSAPLGVPPASEARPVERFGRASVIERRTWPPVSTGPASSVAAPQKYEQWRERRRISVGYSHLSIADLSDDGRFLLAVSENEARLRLYDTASGKLVASNAVSGYAQYGRGDFVFFSGRGDPPAVVFGGDAGLFFVDALSGEQRVMISNLGAWKLRWTGDGSVLGANLSNTSSQTSELAFYTAEGERLEPALLLSFSERVDGFDLSSDGSRLAVVYYPSNEIELLDLRASALLWSAPGPEYAGSVDLSEDDSRVAVGGAHAAVLSVADPSDRAVYTELGNNIHEVRFSPSGDALAVSAYDGRLRLLSASPSDKTLRLRKALRHAGTANVYAIEFTSDGTQLISSSGDQTVRFWGP